MRWLGVALLVCVGCTQKRTEVVIGVATDLPASALPRVTLSASREGVVVIQHDWDISGVPNRPFELPGSFGILADDGGEPHVEVTLRGQLSDAGPITRTSIFRLVSEQTLFLRMALVASCRTVTCPDGRACIEGRCRPLEVNARTLPVYEQDLERFNQCSSGSDFRNTSSGMPLPMRGPGCAAYQWCGENTCYKNELPFSCSPPGQTCTGVAGYESCAIMACDASIASCFGPRWKDGAFAGPCADFARCFVGCRCSPDCVLGCSTSYRGSCESCFTAGVAPCLSAASCTPRMCTGGAATPMCAMLGSCCVRLFGVEQAQCFQTAASGSDTACGTSLDMYRTTGRCP